MSDSPFGVERPNRRLILRSASLKEFSGSYAIEMDALDLEILFLIQNDARVANASVGAKLGLTASAVHARIRRLESQYLTCSSGHLFLGPQASGITCTLNGCEWIPLAITIMS